MKMIRPTPITDASLTSSTLPETDHPAYAAGTTYALGARVIRTSTHRIYESLQASNTGHTPETSPTWWLDVAPTNRWAMFDQQVGTLSTAADSLTVVLSPGRVNSLALLAVDASTVTVTLVANAETVYSASIDLDSGNTVGDWYQYFYEPIYQQDALVITDLLDATLMDIPAYGDGVLTVTLTRTGGTVSLGVLVVGLYATLGRTQYRPSVGIVDYSRKEVDDFGNFTVVRRKYSKRMSAQLVVDHADVDNTARVLAQYRSTPLVWVGADNLYASLIVYGFVKDWDVVIDNFDHSLCNLQIEGLT